MKLSLITPSRLFIGVLGASLMALLAGCQCCKPGQAIAGRSSDDPFGTPPCEPKGELGIFGFPVTLISMENVAGASGYQWYRLNTDEVFTPLISTQTTPDVTSSNLVINPFTISDVAYYARRAIVPGRASLDPIPCDQVYHLMGTTNSNGNFPVWGAPLTAQGNSTYSYCAGSVPCPGVFSKYVPYSLGWLPSMAPGSTGAEDGSSATRPLTKLRFYCSPIPPPVLGPTCGCNGTVTVPGPNATKRYTFTLYFPANIIPQNPHPLNLFNFNR